MLSLFELCWVVFICVELCLIVLNCMTLLGIAIYIVMYHDRAFYKQKQ